MKSYERLLLENKAWASERVHDDPGYFKRLSEVQTPQFLWIGCSDSRVPANEITGTSPGEIFVHRNIANLVVDNDVNLLSVLEYAVDYLKVKHVIVCGHYGCGGIKAAASGPVAGIIDGWLQNIRNIEKSHFTELKSIEKEESRIDRLVELNVMEQVNNLAKTSIIQRAWKNEERPHLHGWVYRLTDGILNNMIHLVPGSYKEYFDKEEILE